MHENSGAVHMLRKTGTFIMYIVYIGLMQRLTNFSIETLDEIIQIYYNVT